MNVERKQEKMLKYNIFYHNIYIYIYIYILFKKKEYSLKCLLIISG